VSNWNHIFEAGHDNVKEQLQRAEQREGISKVVVAFYLLWSDVVHMESSSSFSNPSTLGKAPLFEPRGGHEKRRQMSQSYRNNAMSSCPKFFPAMAQL